jgi:hypothetical protein
MRKPGLPRLPNPLLSTPIIGSSPALTRWGFERGETSLFEGGLQFRRALIDHDAGHTDAAITDI